MVLTKCSSIRDGLGIFAAAGCETVGPHVVMEEVLVKKSKSVGFSIGRGVRGRMAPVPLLMHTVLSIYLATTSNNTSVRTADSQTALCRHIHIN